MPIEETIIAKEFAYKVTKALTLEHRMPKEFSTNRDKLFTSKY